MWALKPEQCRQWGPIPNVTPPIRVPCHIDAPCPECNRSLIGEQLKWQRMGPLAFARIGCKGCTTNVTFVIVDPTQPQSMPGKDPLVFQSPASQPAPLLPPRCAQVSPTAHLIAQQTLVAESLGLSELLGMGYRKALEFLIKDYLIDRQPDAADQIASRPLAQCLESAGSMGHQIREMGKRTAWVANDLTHYVRKRPGLDHTVVKTLLSITAKWIDFELETQELNDTIEHRP